MTNPYRNVPDHQMWRRAVSRVEPHRLDPAVAPKFQVTPDMKVATAGSCFAQHISRRISALGFNYFVPENGASLDEAERQGRQFGVFSARFGNLYTVHQLDQLFAEAFEGRERAETAWQRPDGASSTRTGRRSSPRATTVPRRWPRLAPGISRRCARCFSVPISLSSPWG